MLQNDMAIHFEIITPERVVLKDEVDEVTLPTTEGEITVLPHHIPLVTLSRAGMIRLLKNKKEEYLAVSGGYVEVQPGSRLTILADTADRAEELDLKKIEEAHERARALMEEKRLTDDVAYASAAAGLERELARLKVARRHHSRGGPIISSQETNQND